MGDDPGCVNAVSEKMPGFIGSRREPVGKVLDCGEVRTERFDFGQETRMGDAVDVQENESNKNEVSSRKLSPVEILTRNFGPPKPPFDVQSHVETYKDPQRLENLDNGRTPYRSSISVPQETSRPSLVADSSVETSKDLDMVESITILSASEEHCGTFRPSSLVDSSGETSKDLDEMESLTENMDHRRIPSSSLSVSEGISGPYSGLDRSVETSKDLQRLDHIRTNYSCSMCVSKGTLRPSVIDIDLEKTGPLLENLDPKTAQSFLRTSEGHLGTSRPSTAADRREETFKDLEKLDRIMTENSSTINVSHRTSRPSSVLDHSQETSKDLDKVDLMLENLDHRRSAEIRRNQYTSSLSDGHESNFEPPDVSASLKLDDLELSVSERSFDSRSNFGMSRSSLVEGNIETTRHVGKVGSMLHTLDLRRSSGLGSTLDSSVSDGVEGEEFPGLEVKDLRPSEGGLGVERNSNADHCQSKEHIYCTVYCIANDNYRKLSESTPPLVHGTPSPLEVFKVLPHMGSPNPNAGGEIGHYPEAYSLSDLTDPVMFNNVLNMDELPLTCRVCLDVRPIRPLHCCKKTVCEECLKAYIGSQVLSGRADITCPIPECSGYLEESVVVAHLALEDVAKYKYFLELSRLDSGTKACPQCSLFTSLKGRSQPAPAKVEQKFKIQCSQCQLVWCFKCHAPWHEGLKCRDYRKGDKLLRHWASVMEHGQRNAQKCPRCKIHIQRTEGCDHMTCTQCNTNFCYRCGERYRQLRFFGDHTSNLSVFGCKYRYLPEKTHLRRLIRGSVCVSKILVAPFLVVLMVVVGALALVIGLFAFPIYCICKKRKKHTNGTGRWLC